MKKFFTNLLLIGSIGLSVTLNSCKQNDELCINGLNLELFDSQLKGALNTGLKGYTYLIMRNGQVEYKHSDGYARSPQDGLQYWDEYQNMHVASISKTISTVATLRLLKMKGLSVEEKIYKFLPPDWILGPSVENISFRELMSHRARFKDVINEVETLSTDYQGLKTMVANGRTALVKRKYSNVHHALLRIILPILWDYPNINTSLLYNENYTAQRYEEIVNELVFDPLNINAELKDDNPNSGVLAYSSGSDPSGVFETFDYRKKAGGYGWVLSATDVAKFWAYLWHSDVLIDETQREEMRKSEIGLWNSDDTTGGRYYCKLGGWYKTVDGLEHWLRCAAVEFPDGTAVVLFVNSSGSSIKNKIIEAYEKSFGCF